MPVAPRLRHRREANFGFIPCGCGRTPSPEEHEAELEQVKERWEAVLRGDNPPPMVHHGPVHLRMILDQDDMDQGPERKQHRAALVQIQGHVQYQGGRPRPRRHPFLGFLPCECNQPRSIAEQYAELHKLRERWVAIIRGDNPEPLVHHASLKLTVYIQANGQVDLKDIDVVTPIVLQHKLPTSVAHS